MGRKTLELYLHIPFCVQKCAYCDFLSAPATEQTRREYVELLVREINGYGTIYGGSYEVSTIFIGGGTPSLLSGKEILRTFEALQENFTIQDDAEITLEMNPGTVTEEKFSAWKKAGINRLSIGLQSANDAELKILGRIHSFEKFRKCYEAARRHRFQNINVDLIYDIPGQTVESWKRTLEEVIALKPEHISAYSLIIEEGTPFFERYGEKKCDGVEFPPLPDEETEQSIDCMTKKILAEAGYERYEISNYAKKGSACRHNLGYWEREEYLGIGLGASSLMRHTRFHNTRNYDIYRQNIEAGLDIREDVETLSFEDEIEEFMFLGLRKIRGISMTQFRENFGKSMESVYGEQLRRIQEMGLLKIEDGRVFLTERGLDVSNAVFVEFLHNRV